MQSAVLPSAVAPTICSKTLLGELVPTLDINGETYERLARKAAARNTTVDRLVQPMLEQLAEDEPSTQDRRQALDNWMFLVQQRMNRYPKGFLVDDSRETIYEDRGE
jgi:hypothetical protein